jgi:hypothetical protein
MKTLPKAIAAIVLIVFGTLASGAAMAQHRGHGHFGGGNVRFGISLGFPIFAPAYYPAPYYAYPYAYPAYAYRAPVYVYPPAVTAYSSPPVYVEQGVAQAAPAPSQTGDWYYCAASRAYYPHVGECPAGWQRVPAQPYAR